jgi:AraC-like DNA-binding protein
MEFVSNTLCQCSSQDAIHVFTDVKENAMTIYKNLCKKFDCRLVTAESTQQDQMKIAEEWSNSSFRVLISTSIGLVGNENLNCKYIACAGYLHDNMQVIQAIGRLRPCQRTSYGKIFFCVPFGLPKFRIEEDENHLTSLNNENLLSSENNHDFCWTMSSRGVKLWCMAAICGDRGCSMKLLSKVFGRDTEDCGACQACCLCPLKCQQDKSGERFHVHIKAQVACERVLLKLTQVCLVCKDQKCRGFPIINGKAWRAVPENQGTCFNSVMCFTFGVSSHNRKTQCCDLKYMANKACSECWVFKGVPKEVNRNVYKLFSLLYTFTSYIWYQFCGIRSCRVILKH